MNKEERTAALKNKLRDLYAQRFGCTCDKTYSERQMSDPTCHHHAIKEDMEYCSENDIAGIYSIYEPLLAAKDKRIEELEKAFKHRYIEWWIAFCRLQEDECSISREEEVIREEAERLFDKQYNINQ